jgi:hypothetical protein
MDFDINKEEVGQHCMIGIPRSVMVWMLACAVVTSARSGAQRYKLHFIAKFETRFITS